jgi:hypothetical protein
MHIEKIGKYDYVNLRNEKIRDKIKESYYIKIPYQVFENIVLNKDLTKRQKDMLWLIVRCSIGCQNIFAKMDRSDFKIINIYHSDCTRILQELQSKLYIDWDKENSMIYIQPALIHKNAEYENRLNQITKKTLQFTQEI